jgi:hypothetical protein
MHLSLTELIDVRDGEGGPDARLHAASCPACAAELDRLRAVAEGLRALPPLGPPRDLWPAVRAAIEKRRLRRRIAAPAGAALALAASVLLVIVAPRGIPVPGTTEAARGRAGGAGAAGPARDAEEIARLMRASRQLEEVLDAMSPGSRVLDGRGASAVADLEDRIALIDTRLAVAPAGVRRPAETTALWRERVQLMDALVRAHDTRPAYIGL